MPQIVILVTNDIYVSLLDIPRTNNGQLFTYASDSECLTMLRDEMGSETKFNIKKGRRRPDVWWNLVIWTYCTYVDITDIIVGWQRVEKIISLFFSIFFVCFVMSLDPLPLIFSSQHLMRQ